MSGYEPRPARTRRRPRGPGGSAEAGGDGEPVAAVELIRRVQAGTLSGRTLSVDDRQSCVEHLTMEHYSVPEIAQLLGISSRTVHRDRDAVRKRNAILARPGFTEETLGEVAAILDVLRSGLRRLVRDSSTSAKEKVRASALVWRMTRQHVELLQSVGHVRRAPQQFDAVLTHRQAPAELEEIVRQLGDLGAVYNLAKPEDGPGRKRIASMSRAVEQLLPGEGGAAITPEAPP